MPSAAPGLRASSPCTAAAETTGQQRVEIILKPFYLIDRPLLRERREAIGNGAGAVVVERRHVSAQRDVDGERDLLDQAHGVAPVRTDVARQVEQFVRRKIRGGDAVQDLLVGGVGRAAVFSD